MLFPATAPVYRSLGWELAGGFYEATVPTRSLAALPPADVPAGPLPALRRAGPDDADQVVAVVGAVHESARHCGPATWTAAAVRRWWLDDEDVFCYLAPDGFLAYGWHGSHREHLRPAGGGGLGRDHAGHLVARWARTRPWPNGSRRWWPRTTRSAG